MAKSATTGTSVAALSFESTTFDVVTRNSQPWLRGLQVASALGYKNPTADIANLFDRNADEFTDSMTALVKLPTAGGEQMVRVFSLRGAHLLGMFARTDKAAAFRKWVLDILDAHIATQAPSAEAPYSIAPDQTLSDVQCITLRTMLGEYAPKLPRHKQGTFMMQGWAKLKSHFGTDYRHIPAAQYFDALSIIARHISVWEQSAIKQEDEQKQQAEAEKLSANDWRNLKQAVWRSCNGFRFEMVWTQAIWFYLRRALGVPTPQTYTIEHLPRLSQELYTIVDATHKVHTLLIDIEQEAAKRIFRDSECVDSVVAELQAHAAKRIEALKAAPMQLPTYMVKDMLAIANRNNNGYDHGGDEAPLFFAMAGGAR